MNFTIDRDKWYRGKGFLTSKLLIQEGDDKGKMCCLGQIALQSGIPEEEILGKNSPKRVAASQDKISWLLSEGEGRVLINNELCTNMMAINDSKTITETYREAKLTALAADAGHTLTFV